MKKTLVALAVTAFATSASALTIYEQDGSKVEFDGSIRLRLDKNSTKVDDVKTKRAHSNLHNDGSRFGVKMKHNINDDFYALGRLEFRFNGGERAKTTDQFGDLYAYRAYVGLGSKQFGELTFGRQVTIGDDIAQGGFDYAYGSWDGELTSEGKSVVRYDYKGIDGLQLGVDYRFAEERDDKQEVKDGKLKSGYGVGAVYTFKPAESQSVTVAAGYTRDNFVTETSKKHYKDAYGVGAKYSINDLTLAADYASFFEKDEDKKKNRNGFRLGVKYAVTPTVEVYTNYGYAEGKTKLAGKTTEKETINGFLLGSSYQIHKNVLTYVEGGLVDTKNKTSAKTTKTKDRNIAVGLRVSF